MIKMMNLSRLAVGMLVVAGSAVGTLKAMTTDTLSLTLSEAMRRGMSQNASVQIADLDATRARVDRRAKFGQLFPSINAVGSYGYTLKKQVVYFGGDDANSPMASFMPKGGIEMGQTHNIQAGINASMPLVSPQLWASLRLDAVSVETALEVARASRVDLTAELRKAYMGVLLARDSHQVLSRSLENLKKSYGDIEAKYRRGLVAEYDLIRMDAQVKNLLPEVIRAQQAIRLAEMKLLLLMNYNPQTPLRLEDSLDAYQTIVYDDMLRKSNGQRYSLDANSTLRQLDLAGKSLEAALSTKRMAFMPTLGLSFNYMYNYASDQFKLNNTQRWSPYSTIGLQLSIPLFAGGTRLSEVKSTKLEIEKLALRRLQTERELTLGMSNAQTERRNASEQFVASQGAVHSARKGLEIAEVRYRTGEGTLLELNDAEQTLRQAQLNLHQAIYNYMLATYSIEQLEGRVWED